jgi:RHS repeat-associated protein
MKKKLLYKIISACFLLLLSTAGTLSGQTGNTQSTAIDLGSKSGSFTYTDTKNTSSYTNNYTGRSTNDVYYKFTLTTAMDVVISHCGSAVSDTYVHLLNSSGGFVALNDDYDGEGHCSSTFNSYLKRTNLAAGTYYVVSEGYSQNGNITTTIQGTVQKVEYDLSSKSGSFTYTHTQNTANCFNSYTGRSTNDVFYKFTTTVAMDIIISHCGSAVSDTYVHLLNSSGGIVASNDDYSGEGKCSSTLNSYLKMTNLAAGTYYVVSEGYSQNGSITTKIEGIVPNIGMGVGSTNQNYIHTRTYTNEAGTTYLDAIQYFDGLGRPVQTVQKGITPGTDVSTRKDLVTLQEYDAFGRDDKTWLPAVVSGNNGAYVAPATVKAGAVSTNGSDQKPYSYPVYEASPLNRVVKQFGPGTAWQNTTDEKAVLTAYKTNIAGNATLNCKLYFITGTSQSPTLGQTTNYATGQLYVTEIKDEDGNTSYEFKDKLGQVVLTRQMDGTMAYDTYYVYNDFGKVCFVLPPRIQDEGITQTKLNELAYQYKYDNRNRCIWKKLPGCEPVRYTYDKADRLVYTQDGEQYNKSPKEWTFTIPDAFGRVVLTGICKDTINVSNKVVKGVYTSSGSYKRYNIQVDGINKTFTNAPVILSVNFYDNYDFRGIAEIPTAGTEYNAESGYGTWYGTDYTEANKYKNRGVLTGTLTAQIKSDGTVSSYLYSVMYYDNKKQLVQTKGNNHLTGGIEKEYIAYNFTGQPTQRKHVHQVTSKNTQTEVYAYTYDHAGRLLTTTHQLTDGTTVKPQVTLAENTYDDWGRLKTNKKGSNTNLQSTYAYNVRSWTKSITGSFFNETLYYNESYGGSKALYNGNISAMSWKAQGETNLRGYAFAYDNLSRLTKASYLVNGAVQTYNASTPTNPIYQTTYSYDKHGNIKTLQRYGLTAVSTYGIIDNLTAGHTGNQLKYITDAGPDVAMNASMDFKDYTKGTGVEYTYNKNGAMNKDLNKGISNIAYNSLNLPQMVDIKNQSVEGRNEYTYSADGRKLKAVQKWNPNYNTAPVIGSDVNVSAMTMSITTDYAGNKIYENNNLKRILVDGGYYEGGIYYFYITDHLGNNRVVAQMGGTVVQKNHYYPFGMAFAENAGTSTQPYKYNGKELDGRNGLNWYDYSARYLTLDYPILPMVDPMAEKFYSISPYAYCFNNPLRFIDPTGMEPEDGDPKEKEKSIFGDLASAAKQLVGEILYSMGLHSHQIQSEEPAVLEDASQRRIQAAENIDTVNEVLLTPVPGGSVINKVANGRGEDVTVSDGTLALAEIMPIGKVVKGVKIANSLRKTGTLLESVSDIMANPNLVKGKTLEQVKGIIGKTDGWMGGTLTKGRSAGQGWTYRQLNSKGTDFTGKYIQYSPGSPRHFGGSPYWKVSSGTGGTIRIPIK